MFYVYALFDEREMLPRYIGQTQDVVLRVKQHKLSPRYSNTKKAKWIRSVAAAGFDLEIGILCACHSLEEVLKKECEYIAKYKEMGAELTNSTSGGQGTIGFKHTKSSREKMRANLLGSARHTTPHTLAARHRMSLVKRGKVHTEATKNKMRIAHLGVKKSDIARENMRKAWVLRK